MDPITHGVVGSMAALTSSDEKHRKSAAITGFGAAMLADLETFIQMPGDPLFNLEIHRQFTHSLVFIPAGALMAAALFWLIFRNHLTFPKLYLFSFAGYSTHWFMDLITSYGTEIFWPFIDARFALNIVSVVDPIITVGLILFTLLALFKIRKIYLWAAWVWLFVMLSWGWIQNDRAGSEMQKIADERGHSIEKSVVKPTIGNQLLWRATYISRDTVYTDAIRTGAFTGVKVYKGESEPLIAVETDFEQFEGTTLYNDLLRFSRLSNGYLIRHPQRDDIIGDAAYSMLPTSLIPLWGVKIDSANPDQHLDFLYFRDASSDVREPFMEMLLGRDPG